MIDESGFKNWYNNSKAASRFRTRNSNAKGGKATIFQLYENRCILLSLTVSRILRRRLVMCAIMTSPVNPVGNAINVSGTP